LHHVVAGGAGHELHEGLFPSLPGGFHARERVALDEVGRKEPVDDSGIPCFAGSVDSFEVTANELLVFLRGHGGPEATTRCIGAARERCTAGIEPATQRSTARCFLTKVGLVPPAGIEPATHGLGKMCHELRAAVTASLDAN